jgi:hypothetical protein
MMAINFGWVWRSIDDAKELMMPKTTELIAIIAAAVFS